MGFTSLYLFCWGVHAPWWICGTLDLVHPSETRTPHIGGRSLCVSVDHHCGKEELFSSKWVNGWFDDPIGLQTGLKYSSLIHILGIFLLAQSNNNPHISFSWSLKLTHCHLIGYYQSTASHALTPHYGISLPLCSSLCVISLLVTSIMVFVNLWCYSCSELMKW